MSEHNILISVILPVYNGQDHVGAAIQSLLDQSWRSFELIVINDGSTDQSASVISSFKDPRIIYVHNEQNLGLIKTLNLGLQLAKGDLIARMDHDDIALPTRLERQAAAFAAQPNLCVLGTDYYLVSGLRSRRSASHWSPHSDYLKAILLFSSCFSHPTVMMRNLFRTGELVYEENFKYTEDYRLWTTIAARGDFAVLPVPLLKYRLHAAQTTVQNREAQLKRSETIRRDYLDALGFSYNAQQLRIHNSIGNHEFIATGLQLQEIESWLLTLVGENQAKNIFLPEAFNTAIHKFWIGCCGNTNLGFSAYKRYVRSDLSRLPSKGNFLLLKLLVKCLVRSVRR